MNIGTLIRKSRKEQKLTLKTVAERAAVSEGFLSQVENAVNSPSVETLIRICKALGVDAGDLISQVSQQEKQVVIKRADWGEMEVSKHGFITRRFFAPEYRSVIDSAVLVLEPGKSIPVRKNIRNSQEVICVLQGQVELMLSNVCYPLETGDSVHYWSNPSSQKITNTSKNVSFVLWVGTI